MWWFTCFVIHSRLSCQCIQRWAREQYKLQNQTFMSEKQHPEKWLSAACVLLQPARRCLNTISPLPVYSLFLAMTCFPHLEMAMEATFVTVLFSDSLENALNHGLKHGWQDWRDEGYVLLKFILPLSKIHTNEKTRRALYSCTHTQKWQVEKWPVHRGRLKGMSRLSAQKSSVCVESMNWNHHFSNFINSVWRRASSVHSTLSHDGISLIVGRIGGLKKSLVFCSRFASCLLFDGALNRFLASFLKWILLMVSSYCFTSSLYLQVNITSCK